MEELCILLRYIDFYLIFFLIYFNNLCYLQWRELSYDQATWEEEGDDIPGLKVAIEYYLDLRAASLSNTGSKPGRKPKSCKLKTPPHN